MSDDITLPDSLDEDDKRYIEELHSMSEEEMLAHMRKMRDNLRANGGKLAREQGLSDEYLAILDGSIAKLEKAVFDEQIANARLAEAARQMSAAADVYLEVLDDQSEYPQIIDDKLKGLKD